MAGKSSWLEINLFLLSDLDKFGIMRRKSDTEKPMRKPAFAIVAVFKSRSESLSQRQGQCCNWKVGRISEYAVRDHKKVRMSKQGSGE